MVILHFSQQLTSFSVLTSCSIQAAARILTTLLGLIRTSSRYRDPNTTCRATHTQNSIVQSAHHINKHSQLLISVTEVLSPSVSMFWSGISKLISIMLDSFQEPLNMLEKYPDCKMQEGREKRRRKSIK